MALPPTRRVRLRVRLAVQGCGLALVLALGWSIGSVGAAPEDAGLRVLPLGDSLEQVLADDVGHRFDRRPVRDLTIDTDGTVWALQGRRVIELGRDGSTAPRSQGWNHAIRRLEVGADGALWALEDGGAVTGLVGDALEDRSGGRRTVGVSLAALPDGRVWRTVRQPGQHATIVTTTDGTEWAEVPSPGLEDLLVPGAARHSFAQTGDGRVWLGLDRGEHGGGLAVQDELGWSVIDDEIVEGSLRVRALEPADDGSLWLLAEAGRPGPSARHVLAHVLEDRLEVLGEAAGMPQDDALAWTGWSPLEPSALVVDAAGRVWFSMGDIGLWTYDGAGFERVEAAGLQRGALDLERAPDGSIWIVGRSGQLYRQGAVPQP